MVNNNHIVISLGGSLIYPPGGIDIDFLKKFNKFIRRNLDENPGRRFFIVTGGGRVARMYQEVAQEVTERKISDEDLDWLGITSTRSNACLIRTIFADIAHWEIVKDYDDLPVLEKQILVGGGWNPGHSTDFDAIKFAEHYDAEVVINLSNIKQLYDKDPNEHKDVKPFENISWKEFIGIVGGDWVPGKNFPFDPVAAKMAMELKKKVVIIHGKDFAELEKYLKGDTFTGTVISNQL